MGEKSWWAPFGKLAEQINPETKAGLRVLTVLGILGGVLLFVAYFVRPIAAVDEAIKREGVPDWPFYLGSAVLVFVLVIVLFSHDFLYHGDPTTDKYVKAFQSNWPSKEVASLLGVDSEHASHLWFMEFNRWADESHGMHEVWKKTLQRGYACRMVFYLLVVSKWAFVSAVAYLVVEAVLKLRLELEWARPGGIAFRIMFVIGSGLVALALRYTNGVTASGPRGVWRRYNEINRMSCRWVREHQHRFAKGNTRQDEADAPADRA